MKFRISLFLTLFFAGQILAQETVDSFRWFWINASYGIPVITNSSYNENGIIEIKAGARLTESNITLVGGVNNTVSQIPERFSLFLGPGYFFKDRWIFFGIHTGISYPFYKNSPDHQQNLGMHNALDLGLRIVPKFAVGVGMNQHISNDIPSYTFRFFIQISSE